MRALLQRVSEAQVRIGEEIAGRIATGLLVFLGVFPDDTEADADWLADKTLALRIFPDEMHNMNRSVADIDGGVLVVSQFTLAADTRRGNRPGFSSAASPEQAERLYDYFVGRLRAAHSPVETGRFGDHMQVRLVNDGPVTILLEHPR
ncbi:MAG: D-aminoacyl-tRNA deacylase [Gammaproteobacteria bacterium]|jgi:D-tyrosyl-tRNA(Tyr) deacylase